jgi:hypothetical protein
VTAVGIIKAQRRFGLSEDGIAGPKTLRALLEPLIAAKATQYALPLDVLGGVCVFESGLDLAAVGVSGWDTGICQINLAASAARGMTVADAVDPSRALDFTAKAMRVVHDRWAGKTEADVYDVVVASTTARSRPRSSRKQGRSPTPRTAQITGSSRSRLRPEGEKRMVTDPYGTDIASLVPMDLDPEPIAGGAKPKAIRTTGGRERRSRPKPSWKATPSRTRMTRRRDLDEEADRALTEEGGD